jgi:hypothetical protein
MEGQKNGENGKKIRRVVRLTLHNTGLHITRPFFVKKRSCRYCRCNEKISYRIYGIL